jgi:uncharacterized protein with PQ loop repeat
MKFEIYMMALSTVAVVTIWHQVWLVWKKGHHDQVSVPFVTLSFLVVVSWLIYGLRLKDTPLIYSSILHVFALGSLLTLILVQRNGGTTDTIQHV